MKIIVLGTGIAGYGAYLACKDLGKLNEVVFYNYGNKISNKPIKGSNFPGVKFPAKKEFGQNYQAEDIQGSKFKIRYSSSQGGLSDFWSGSVSTFSDQELKLRNLNFLKKFYKLISNKIEIMGPRNGISSFCENYRITKNFESIEPLNCFDNIRFEGDDFSLLSENNKVLVSGNCVMCGQCFSGCEQGVIFRPMKKFEGATIRNEKIERIRMQDQKWCLLDSEGNCVDVCDVLFLACGTFQTIKLLNNSKLLDHENVELYDSNAIIFGIKLKSTSNHYIKNYGYANKIISIEGRVARNLDTQISIIPFNNFFTESLLGSVVGKMFNGFFLNNFALGMFFSSPCESNTYKISSDNKLSVLEDNSELAKSTLHEISNNFNRSKNDFKILNLFKSADSSIHYSSNLLDQSEDFFKRAEYSNNLYIIDGNLFPGKPSANGNSLSIMAGSYAVIKNYFDNVL